MFKVNFVIGRFSELIHPSFFGELFILNCEKLFLSNFNRNFTVISPIANSNLLLIVIIFIKIVVNFKKEEIQKYNPQIENALKQHLVNFFRL